MKDRVNKWLIGTIVVLTLIFPFFLNCVLQIKAFVPVVGDSVTWLTFWPVYLSAIASFGMIYFTYRSLQQNKRQLEEMKHQREEEERARLVFSVIVYKKAFMLKISNVGKRNVYNAVIQFNDDFLNELLEEKFQEGYKQLSKPFFVEAGTSRHLYIGWCQDINDAWKNKHVVIKMNGHYNDVYSIDEVIEMDLYLDKTFMLVQGEIATELALIKQGLVNNSYSPIQVNLDRITKSLANVDTSLKEIAERLEKQGDASTAEDKETIIQQTPLSNGGNDFEEGLKVE